MKKLELEYVISAVAQGMFPNNKKLDAQAQDQIRIGLQSIVEVVRADVKKNCKHYTPQLSMLFNAYTEDQYIDYFKYLENMHMENVYADSGGLQIVTTGKEKTEELKQGVYEIQAYADYAMCFDEIPLTRKEGQEHKRTRNERSNTGNKLYHHSRLIASGNETGKNIKAQIETFKRLKTDTKVVPIVQGNSAEDMVVFFDEISRLLKGDDWDHVSGLAVADTCIGNGELESIEMLRAAHKIADYCHPNVAKHLHILGVGSIMRMRPIIYLQRSKYLDSYKKISYDSSSHTSTFTYGLLKVNGTCKPLGGHRNKKVEEHFKNVYRLFSAYLEWMKVSEWQFLEIILGPKQANRTHETTLDTWTHAAIKERALTGKMGYLNIQDPETVITIAHLAKAFHTLYQIHNFMICLDGIWKDKFRGDPMTNLLKVKNDDDMDRWMKVMKTEIRSKRIERNSNKATLEGLIV